MYTLLTLYKNLYGAYAQYSDVAVMYPKQKHGPFSASLSSKESLMT